MLGNYGFYPFVGYRNSNRLTLQYGREGGGSKGRVDTVSCTMQPKAM
jgi:hypothetical protein